MGIPGWGLGRLLTPPVVYSEERELDVETESKMTHEEKGSNKGQPQAEAVKDKVDAQDLDEAKSLMDKIHQSFSSKALKKLGAVSVFIQKHRTNI